MNAWKLFQKLVGQSEVRVGTVISISGTETILEDSGGSRFRATGTDVTSGKAFVKDGVVIGAAPNLTNVGVQWV